MLILLPLLYAIMTYAIDIDYDIIMLPLLIIDAIDDIDIDITLFTILMPLTPLRH
jgi:hypothetical protein